MEKKRITRKEWEYIGKYNPAAKWLRPLCSYSLEKSFNGCFCRECKISWPVYLVIFIPVHILQLLYCLWDGGLKEFEIESRSLGYKVFHSYDSAYTQAKEIWEKHK